MSRTARQRLDAMGDVIAAGAAFRGRVVEAEGDVVRCADLMAEAIAMHRSQRPLETVGKGGRVMMTIENLEAMYCMDAARAAYALARGSNSDFMGEKEGAGEE